TPALCAARRELPALAAALGIPKGCRLGPPAPPGRFHRRERPWPTAPGTRRGLVRVGLFAPRLDRGLAERGVRGLIDHCDRSRVSWAGVAVRHLDDSDERAEADFALRTTVAKGAAAFDALYRCVDVALVCGLVTRERRTPARPRNSKIVLVSHG